MAQICPLCPAVLRCLTRAHPENRGGATIWRQLLCGSLGVEPDGWDGAFALPTALREAGLVAGGQVTCAIKYVVVIFANTGPQGLVRTSKRPAQSPCFRAVRTNQWFINSR